MGNAVTDVLDAARHEVGVHESGGNNRGARVEQYLASVGLPPGEPWCAAFVAFCFQQARVPGWPATGDTWALEAWAKENGVYTDHPNPGDVFLMLKADGTPFHTGFVAGVNLDTEIATIEGNTDGLSPSDGDSVARKVHPISSCRYIRWARVLASSAGPVPRFVKIYWHDGKGAIVIDGQEHPITGVKISTADGSLVPWAGGEIRVGVR